MYARSNAACLAAVWLISFTSAIPVLGQYAGHRVVRCDVRTPRELQIAESLTDDIWNCTHGVGPLLMRVTPDQYDQLLLSPLRFELLIQDLQPVIDAHMAQVSALLAAEGDWYATFRPLEDIDARLDALIAAHPALVSETVPGVSHEQRPIRVLHISGPGSQQRDRPVVVVNACQHAREWVSPMVGMYLIEHLLTTYDSDARTKRLVDEIEWVIAPMLNPDGYVYSWTDERLWRKNRRPAPKGSDCIGVDLNRNWAYEWGGLGASTNPCDSTYRGPAALSEPELTAFTNHLQPFTGRAVAAVDLHSYSQMILGAWGYTCDPPADAEEYDRLGLLMREAIESVSGQLYRHGQSCTLLYPSSGAARDWYQGALGAFGWTIELRDHGADMFEIAPELIVPTAEEALEALLSLAEDRIAPLQIRITADLPRSVAACQPAAIDFDVLPGTQAVDPAGVTLWVKDAGAGTFTSYRAQAFGGDAFRALLPARGCGPALEYYIAAQSTAGGVVTTPRLAPEVLHRAYVGSIRALLADDFETDRGWKVQSDSPVGGVWDRGDPVGKFLAFNPIQPEDDTSPNGTLCFVTGPQGGGSGQGDVDSGPTRLISPLFAEAGSDPIVSYDRWFFTSTYNDELVAEASVDGGATWVQLESNVAWHEWRRREFRIQDYVSVSGALRVRFVASDLPNNSVTEAAIDEFRLESLDCTGLTADLTGDGVVDQLDLNVLLSCFNELGAACGDLDGDGATWQLDLNLLLASFGQVCGG